MAREASRPSSRRLRSLEHAQRLAQPTTTESPTNNHQPTANRQPPSSRYEAELEDALEDSYAKYLERKGHREDVAKVGWGPVGACLFWLPIACFGPRLPAFDAGLGRCWGALWRKLGSVLL